MKPLLWDAINPLTGTPFTWDDPNLRWDGPAPAITQPKKKARKYMASNPTPPTIPAAPQAMLPLPVAHGKKLS